MRERLLYRFAIFSRYTTDVSGTLRKPKIIFVANEFTVCESMSWASTVPDDVQTTSEKKHRRKDETTSDRRKRVIIVEDHHDVLPWLYLVMRRKMVPHSKLHLVHIDAHPDLGAVTDASVLRTPDALIRYLDDSEYGISEWILPLVASGPVPKSNFYPSLDFSFSFRTWSAS